MSGIDYARSLANGMTFELLAHASYKDEVAYDIVRARETIEGRVLAGQPAAGLRSSREGAGVGSRALGDAVGPEASPSAFRAPLLSCPSNPGFTLHEYGTPCVGREAGHRMRKYGISAQSGFVRIDRAPSRLENRPTERTWAESLQSSAQAPRREGGQARRDGRAEDNYRRALPLQSKTLLCFLVKEECDAQRSDRMGQRR